MGEIILALDNLGAPAALLSLLISKRTDRIRADQDGWIPLGQKRGNGKAEKISGDLQIVARFLPASASPVIQSEPEPTVSAQEKSSEQTKEKPISQDKDKSPKRELPEATNEPQEQVDTSSDAIAPLATVVDEKPIPADGEQAKQPVEKAQPKTDDSANDKDAKLEASVGDKGVPGQPYVEPTSTVAAPATKAIKETTPALARASNQLQVKVIAGRHLASKDSNGSHSVQATTKGFNQTGNAGFSDPFCKLFLEDIKGKADEKSKKKTIVIKKSLDPTWDTTFTLYLACPPCPSETDPINPAMFCRSTNPWSSAAGMKTPWAKISWERSSWLLTIWVRLSVEFFGVY